MTPIAFETPAKLRAWLAKNAATKTELWILFYKVRSKRKSVRYPEALDEALCVGWIDGILKRLDDESYIQRFTPRKKDSYWSSVNIRKAEALIASGRMKAAGLAAFERRDASAARRYSFENRTQDLPPKALATLKKNKPAFTFWQAQPASYRKMATWWLASAKKEETKARRLEQFIAHHAKGERIPQFVSPRKSAKASRGKRAPTQPMGTARGSRTRSAGSG